MVRPWDDACLKGLKLTKIRIKKMEVAGMGTEVMREKLILKNQLRHIDLEKVKGRFK